MFVNPKKNHFKLLFHSVTILCVAEMWPKKFQGASFKVVVVETARRERRLC